MDFELTEMFIKTVKWVPVLYLANAWWFFSNKQIFDGWINLRVTTDEEMLTSHNLTTSLNINHAIPLFLISVAWLLIMVF